MDQFHFHSLAIPRAIDTSPLYANGIELLELNTVGDSQVFLFLELRKL